MTIHIHDPEAVFALFRRIKLDSNDPSTVALKNPPAPCLAPAPKATLSLPEFPHILERLLEYANKHTLLALRATCQYVCTLVDRQFAAHIQIHSDGLDLDITARFLGRIPGLRFRGPISLGVSPISDDEAASSPQLGPDTILRLLDPTKSPDVWLRVLPSTVPWLDEFMKHVMIVDLDGPFMTVILPLSRAQQADRDPYGRVFVDKYPIRLIRMFPGADGAYCNFVPFTSKYIHHSIQLCDPTCPADKTWLAHIPLLPEGTKQFHLGVHLSPSLDYDVLAGGFGFVTYPSSIHTVIVNLAMHPATATPTGSSLASLRSFWLKVFYNFRPGISFYICNIHQWDVTVSGNPRHLVVLMFANAWFRGQLPTLDIGELWELCSPHLLFFRGGNEWVFTETEKTFVHYNLGGTPHSD